MKSKIESLMFICFLVVMACAIAINSISDASLRREIIQNRNITRELTNRNHEILKKNTEVLDRVDSQLLRHAAPATQP